MTKQIGADGITISERRALKSLFEGKNITESLIDGGYTESTADKAASVILDKPRVQSALTRALQAEGIDDASIARLIKRGLGARKEIYYNGSHIASDPDHYARHQYLRTALEVRGDIGSVSRAGEQDGSWEEMIVAIRRRKAVSSTPEDSTTQIIDTTAEE